MRTALKGDRVQVHYVKRFQDGSEESSHPQPPVELTIGTRHALLPGLGTALVGLAPGTTTTVRVPAERAYGRHDADRIYRLTRKRFAADQPLEVGQWLTLTDRQGRQRLVRILQADPAVVVVDNNHPRAGQALTLEVELVAILDATADATVGHP